MFLYVATQSEMKRYTCVANEYIPNEHLLEYISVQ